MPAADCDSTEPDAISSASYIGFAAIERLADANGIMQHSRHSLPDPDHGYCLDDNARALILMHRSPDLPNLVYDRWAKVFADFVERAWNPELRRFRNFMSHDGAWLEESGSEDSWGRGMWSLGVTAAESRLPDQRAWALGLFGQAAGPLLAIASPRAMAFCILGAERILKVDAGDEGATRMIDRFTDRLGRGAALESRPGWPWFERRLAYDNCRLPEALLRASATPGRTHLVPLGLETLAWVAAKQQAPEGHFRAVGSAGFGQDYCDPELFDQQPLEAQGMIEACAAAYDVTGDPAWIARAEAAFAWFHGANDGAVPLADQASGECYDGLTPTGANLNRGAESVLAYQLAARAIAALRQRGQKC